MPYKKRYPKRRPKKKNKMVMYRNPSYIGKADYSGKFHCNPIDLSNDSTLDTRLAFAFRLSDIHNFSSWTTLFDQFRINKVVCKFTPVNATVVNRPYDDTTNPGASVSETPRLVMCKDRDDEAAPIDFNSLQSRQGSKTIQATKSYTWVFKPTRLVPVYRTATTSGYMLDPNTKAYLDVANGANVPHYGMKCVLEATSPSNAFQYKIERTYYVSFKNRRF